MSSVDASVVVYRGLHDGFCPKGFASGDVM